MATRTATTAAATVAPPRPTATATVPAIAPGIYANSIQTDPAEPHSGNNITFRVTLLNSTGGAQSVKWFVKIFEPDNQRNSKGETAKVTHTVPVGSAILSTGNDWHISVSVCTNYIARVYRVDAGNNPIELNRSDGGSPATTITICP